MAPVYPFEVASGLIIVKVLFVIILSYLRGKSGGKTLKSLIFIPVFVKTVNFF